MAARSTLARPAAVREPATAAPAPPQALAATPGNQAMQRLLRGRPGDASEREADRLARRLTAAPVGPPARPPAFAGRAAPATGRAGAGLPPASRARFESQLGLDLAGVRLHRDPEAAAAADSLGAIAFAQGADISFGAAAPPLHTPAGEQALAHEVAHVALRHDGVRRQTPHDASPPPAAPTPTAEPNLQALTNADFVAQMASARDPAASADHRAAVEAERARREAMGHQWLTADLSATPSAFYRLLPHGGDTVVVGCDAAVALGPPIETTRMPIVTPEQFNRRLALRSIPTVAISSLAEARSAMVAPPVSPPTVRTPGGGSAPYVIADPITAPQGMRTVEVHVPAAFTVAPGAFSDAPSSFPPGVLERVRAGMPTNEDLALLLGHPVNADASVRALLAFQEGQALGVGSDISRQQGRIVGDAYVAAMPGSGGVGRALLGDRMLRALRSNASAMGLTVNDANTRAPEVEAFHAEIHGVSGARGEAPRGGKSYYLDRQQMARVAAKWSTTASPQERALLDRIAAGDTAAVAELQQLPAAAAGPLDVAAAQTWSFGPGRGNQFLLRTASPFTPEYNAAQRSGGWAAPGSAGVGALSGMGLALGLDLGISLAQGDMQGFEDRAPRTATLGAVGGAATMTAQQLLVSRTSAQLIAQGIAPSLASGARLLGARMASGGIGAGAVELVLIYGFEDREHSGTEVAERVGRSSAIGAVSAGAASLATAGFLAAMWGGAETGAAAGTVVPGWGNALGFVVGGLVGAGTYYLLDRAVPRPDPTPQSQ
ncbi:MAG TPA: DUF4157 domain-containing protein [Caulobacteraceae bacterium]